jgi:hypothetical protein
MRQEKIFETRHHRLFLWLLSGLLGLQPLAGMAYQSIALVWNPSTSLNIRGYQIYYGTNSQNYCHQFTVSGSVTNTTIWGLTGGQTYYFAASSFNTAREQSSLSAEMAYTLPPDATNQPPILTKLLTSKAFVAGQNVSFCISAIGTGTLNYQWNFNGQILPGETNAMLTLNNATADQAGTYFATVSDDIGTTNSNPANLSFHVAPASAEVAATLSTVTGLATPNDAGNQYAFDVSGIAGDAYVVQTTTNFTDWVSVQTNLAPFTFVDTNVNQSGQLFYRAVHQ